MLGNEAKTITPFERKVWLSSPTMHGDELKYVTEAYETNWMSTVGKNINEVESLAVKKVGCKYAVALSAGTAALHMAVKLAARYMTKDQVIELRDINNEMEDALKDKALAKITEADKRFHSSICAGANNQVLQKTMAMLDAEVLRYRVDYIKGIEDYMQLIKEHKELIDAIDARDEEKAEELMSRHIENQKKKVLEALESEKE